MSENKLGVSGAESVKDILLHNSNITRFTASGELFFGDKEIQDTFAPPAPPPSAAAPPSSPPPLPLLRPPPPRHHHLHHLFFHLTGNGFDDKAVEILAEAVQVSYQPSLLLI